MKQLTIILAILFFVALILLTQCTRTENLMECENNTIIINNTIFINKTIEIPCNLTCEECNYTSETNREIDLIQRIKYLEGQQDLYFNDSECGWELNNTENDLEDCEEEICDNWNSSWC